MNLRYVICSEIIDVRDGTHDSPKYIIDGGYPLITSKNINNNKIDFSNVNYISEEDYIKINQRSEVSSGDIIMPMIGTIGNPVIIDTDKKFAIKNVALFKLANNETILSKYFYYILKTQDIKRQLESNKRGGTQNFVSLKNIRDLKIPLIDILEQKKIVEILDKAQELIDKRKEQIEALDELVKSKFIEMFGSQKYPLVKAEDICEYITKGTTPKSSEIIEEYNDDLIPYLKVYNLSFDGSMLFDEKAQYITLETHNKFLARSKVYPNDILMNIVGPPLGKFAIVPNTFSEWNINQAIAIFRATNKVNPIYLLYSLKQPKVLKPFIDSAVGIRQQNLSLLQCRNLEIQLPPLSLQNQFADFVNKVNKLKSEMEKSLKELEDNFNSLMQKSFKGELFN